MLGLPYVFSVLQSTLVPSVAMRLSSQESSAIVVGKVIVVKTVVIHRSQTRILQSLHVPSNLVLCVGELP
jgi:uncharacterized protein (UPF0548 family)